MPNPNKQSSRIDPDEVVGGFLDIVARFAFFGGLLVTVGSLALLCYLYSAFAGSNPPGPAEQALANIALASKLFYVGGIAAIAGSTYLFWGEEILGVIQLMVSGALWATPFFLPSMLGGGEAGNGQVTSAALGVIQTGGTIMGGLSVVVLIADIVARVKLRAQQGAKAELLKYGKGVKEEKDIKNVFMGKCWQLPFCRKFVRDLCPIYHSKRTCWREKVGCMCEEEVIRKAMEGRPIPKDMVAAAKFIPYNHKVPLEAKKERCRSCVIYNEHQKHKYKLILWLVLIFFVGFYVLLRQPLLSAVGNVINRIDSIFSSMTFSKAGISQNVNQQAVPLQEFLLICILVVSLAYVLKAVEYAVFKLKV